MTNQYTVNELEAIILGKPGSCAFPTNNEERISAVRELEKHGLRGLGVIGNYWMLKGHFEVKESSSEMENVLNDVWKKIHHNYGSIQTNSEFVRKVAEEIVGYLPSDDEVLPEQTYQKIYSTVHAVLFPAVMMGSVDSFGEGQANSLTRLLTGIHEFKKIYHIDFNRK